MYATEVLARFGAGFRASAVAPAVIHDAKRAVVDWYASVFPGCATAPVRLLTHTLADDLDRGKATLAQGRPATPRAAALINGTAAHAAEVDDSFRAPMYHPGAATIAAALAAGQEVGASGAEFLRAVVVGYEVSTRIGVALGRPHYRYWHNTGTVGVFGAAAAAAYLYRLDAAAFAHALATAATCSAGLQQAFRMDSMSKPLHAGRAAESGLLAAALAGNGLTGSLDVLDGESGMGRAMSDGADWSDLGATLGTVFHIQGLTFKNHIGCGHVFPSIDGVLALRAQHGLAPDDIERVIVGTYQAALDIACHGDPASANEARFSMPFMLATALVHGSVRMRAYETAGLADPAVRALMPRIAVGLDPELDARFPARRAARIEIVCRDGRRLRHLQPDRKGDPEDPLGDADLGDKLLELAGPFIGDARAGALLARLWRAELALTLDW
nr:MmgE/PrpD family protein [uncultured Duganella sp.]